jgi:signal transduction histidine kinase
MPASSDLRLPTDFAPAERLSAAEIAEQIAQLGSRENLQRLLDTLPSLVVILNAERQILLANTAVKKLAHELQRESHAGMRPGEFLACRQAASAEHGCGTTEACRTCGAVQAILGAGAGQQTAKECRIATVAGTAYDLRVTASPFEWEGRGYLFVVLDDISDEKRRNLLERVFFHDVLNTAGSLSGIASMIADEPALTYDLKDDLLLSAETLVTEIKSQRLLLAAEHGELQPQPEPVGVAEALKNVQQLYRNHPAAAGRQIKLDLNGKNCTVKTDPAILQRVLANMLKNALEASPKGGIVWLGADAGADNCTLWCHNDGEIPREVALQIFQRSFSTKGRGRGIGTYSIKLLGERYLDGCVSFKTSKEEGTRFQICLPPG